MARRVSPGMTQSAGGLMSASGRLRPLPLVADGKQFHGAVGDDDSEGGADGAFDQMDVAAMGANQLGGNRKAKAAAAGAAGGLERLEQMSPGLRGDAGAGVGDLENCDR